MFKRNKSWQHTADGTRIYKRLLSFSLAYWRYFLAGCLAALGVSAVDAGITWLIKPVINNLHLGRAVWYISWMPLIFFLLCIFRGGFSFCSSYYIQRMARIMVMKFRNMIFDRLLVLPANFYDRNSSGTLLSTIIYNVDQISSASSSALQTVLRDFSYTIFLIIVMFVLDWRLALVILIIGPVIALFIKKNSVRLRRLSANLQNSMGDVSSIATESLQGYKIVRLFGQQQQQAQAFYAATNRNKNFELKSVVTNTLNSIFVVLIASVPVSLLLFVVVHTSISAGTFVAFVIALINIQRPIRRLTSVNADIQRGIAGAESVFALIDEPQEVDKGLLQLAHYSGEIDVENVSFTYPSASLPALHEVNLKVRHGQMVAVVGPSGSGKSTLIQLIPRFYDIDSGSIKLAGRPITDYSLSTLRSQMSIVTQDTFLFNGTIRQNVAYALPDCEVSEEDLMRVLKLASAMEFVSRLPAGIDTVIGDNGVLLSGGEKQRIAIARAFLKDAPLLILDEATSSLDSLSERAIQEAMDKLLVGRTSIVIAHRLSTIVRADIIYVMQTGSMVERGKHAELLAAGGLYAEIYNSQYIAK